MAQQLIALVALAEDPGSILRTPHDGSQPSIIPVPGDPSIDAGKAPKMLLEVHTNL